MQKSAAEAAGRLETEHNIWLATVRPDGRPHLAPVWFAWLDEKIYICTEPGSVKGRNTAGNPRVALALENGSHPVICEGTGRFVPAPWPDPVRAVFKQKYDWDITVDTQYTALIEVTPAKWLGW